MKIIPPLFMSAALFSSPLYSEQITPYKFIDGEILSYKIPTSSRYTTPRLERGAPDIVYYFSPPPQKNYPIAILCEGSSQKESLKSVIHFHRYFLQEFMDLGAGVLSLEKWGIDGDIIQPDDFMHHYTRTQRLQDHIAVIEHLKLYPPKGWNGTFIFLGVSEGGHIVTKLSEKQPPLATINWSGGGDGACWQEEVWLFLQQLLLKNPNCPHNVKLSACSACLEIFSSRSHYGAKMEAILKDPSDEIFLGMTHKYHADALNWAPCDYEKITSPYLLVTGTLDTILELSDSFVEKAKKAKVPITYLRISDMDHYIRKRPDIIQESFTWMGQYLKKSLDELK